MSTREDPYPTRCFEHPRILERQDPIVHGSNAGPLSKQQVDRFETKGCKNRRN
jgi:hypothetical protein